MLAGVRRAAPAAAVVGHQGDAGGALWRPGPPGREGDLEVLYGLRLRSERSPARTTVHDGSPRFQEVCGHVTMIAREQNGPPGHSCLLEEVAEGRDVVDTPWMTGRRVALQSVVDRVDDDGKNPPVRVLD